MVDIPVQQVKPAEQRPPLVDTTMTLIPETTTLSPKPQSQPPQTKKSKTKVLLKKSKKPGAQFNIGELDNRVTRLEKTVNAKSRFNLPKAIDKSVKAHLKNILSKYVLDFGKIKIKKAAKKSTLKNDADTSSPKKSKAQSKSSKSTKAPPGPSQTKKVMDEDEKLQDGIVDDKKIAQDADMGVDDLPQADTAPTQDQSKWWYKTRSSEKELFTPYEEPERFEDEVAKIVGEPTMEEYITITQINYESGNNEKGKIELKGRFLIKLRNNAFSRTNGEDALEHIENFLEIVDLLNVPNVSHNQLMVRVFHFSLTEATSKWWEGTIRLWMDTLRMLYGTIREEEMMKRIDIDIFYFKTPLRQAFKEFNYLS
nr:hypothetical protein [Tanacetum cinerariifolium]